MEFYTRMIEFPVEQEQEAKQCWQSWMEFCETSQKNFGCSRMLVPNYNSFIVTLICEEEDVFHALENFASEHNWELKEITDDEINFVVMERRLRNVIAIESGDEDKPHFRKREHVMDMYTFERKPNNGS